MNNCVDKPCSFTDKDDNEVNLSSFGSFDHRCLNDKKNDSNYHFTVWGLNNTELGFDDKYDAIFNTNLSEQLRENDTSEERVIDDKNCICIDRWNQLKQVFEQTDEKIKMTNSIENACPGGSFSNLLIDLKNDDCGENLEDFQLDGEYWCRTSFDDLSFDELNKNKTVQIKEKELTFEEPEESNVLNKETDHKNSQNRKNKKNNAKQNDSINLKTNKSNEFSDNKSSISHKSSDRENKKKLVVGESKASEKSFKCCTGVESTAGLNNQKEEKTNNMPYVYTYGEVYRGGIHYGHRDCIDCWIPIPRNKGWVTGQYQMIVSS